MSVARMNSLGVSLAGARWRLVVPVAFGVMVLTFLLARSLIFVWDGTIYSSETGMIRALQGYTRDDILWLPRAMGTYGLPALHFLLTFAGAAWVTRRTGEWTIHGPLVGLLATFYGQVVMLIVWPTTSFSQVIAGWGILALPFPRAAEYLAVGLAGGLLGGASAWATLVRREALLRASRGIGAAGGTREVAAAIGEHLARRDVIGVSVWHAESAGAEGRTAAYSRPEVWVPRTLEGWPFGERLDAEALPALAGLREGEPVVAGRRGMRSPGREACGKLGVRSVLLVALMAPRGDRVGLLLVASRRRWGFGGKVVRGYSTVGAQAALALENARLVEEARRVGQEAGTLRERNRLAREIHDTLAQGFVSIVMNVEASEGTKDPETSLRNGRIARTARESLAEARRMVVALGPEQLEGVSLPEALDNLVRRFSEDSGVAADVVTDGEPLSLTPGAETTLLRVAQEALHNVRKHGGASLDRVRLTLSYMGDRAVLDVRDDGEGFDPTDALGGRGDDVSGGFGLRGMRSRVEEAGGVLRVESASGEGTTLTVEMPRRAGSTGVGQRTSDESVDSKAAS